MTLSREERLQKLQSLLLVDKRERHDREAAQRRRNAQVAPLRYTIKQYWVSQASKNPSPVPLSLFRCPTQPPTMTLVRWSSLSVPLQEKLACFRPATSDDDASDAIVSVPTALIDPGNGMEQPDMTKKMSEYTRGLSGKVKPFRPGGMEEEDDSEEVAAPRAEEEKVERSAAVLGQSTHLSWEQGLLLTAPPSGSTFRVGLSHDHLHGNLTRSSNVEPLTQPEPVPSSQPWPSLTNSKKAQAAASPYTSDLFTQSYFEDDFLFGSSSSGESSHDSEDDKSDNGVAETFESNQFQTTTGQNDNITESATTELDTAGEIDSLLESLDLADTNRMFEKKRAQVQENALELAEVRMQQNSTRKSWASKQLLPIRDLSSYIPNMAMTFPFKLDTFQEQAVARLERSESVFVAAHTSAGKTVVAEYAVALARQRATRCIYTSPIKALSNQKFRDFCLKYGADQVGLVTGDLQVNVDDSTVLIMTTEILRSMLYRGADLIRDIEFVIFDEVHYVNDSERGVVWEEVIIMLPSYVNLVFLSATTPNTFEFSDWIGRTKRKPVFVVTTNYRPVPLSHHLWAGTKLHKILEGKGSILEKGYNQAAQALLPQSARDAGNKSKGKQIYKPKTGSKQMTWQAQGSKQNWVSLVRFLDRELLTPAVIFSFSKRKCEEIAQMLRSLDLNTAKERSAVQGFTIQTVARLSETDSKLPQVQLICEMAARGIGVHHGGLLPILKEMIEILCSRNLIKILMATETFAMGVNMPMRCVVFNSIRKHDGKQFRMLEPGEYTQMAGRAGRRGLDTVGTVILCCFGETPPPQQIIKNMLTGRSTTLRSQFRLTYNMILNLFRVEEMSVESMIKRSFSEFATQRALAANEYPKLLARGKNTLEKLKLKDLGANIIGAEDIDAYYKVCSELLQSNLKVLKYIHKMERIHFDEIMQPGRIILVSSARKHRVVRSPAIILKSGLQGTSGVGSVSVLRRHPQSFGGVLKCVCVLLLPANYVKKDRGNDITEGLLGFVGTSSNNRHYMVVEVEVGHILVVTALKKQIDVRIFYDEGTQQQKGIRRTPGADSNPFAGMTSMGKKGPKGGVSKATGKVETARMVDETIVSLVEVEEMENRLPGVPILDLRNYIKRGEEAISYRKGFEEIEEQMAEARGFTSHYHPNLEELYVGMERRSALSEKVHNLERVLSNESLQLFPDFLQRKDVLKRLGYIDANETVCVKGRVACEVNTCEELIAAEMIFEGTLNELEPEEIAAVLSALVFQEKKDEDISRELPERMLTCCDNMKTIVENLGQLQKEAGLEVDPNEYCENSLKFGLVHVVYEWALGVPFKTICELTEVQEGSIVRCITRLDELCREIRNCARVVGNPTLYRKMEDASTSIKRDIVFASSLYVS